MMKTIIPQWPAPKGVVACSSTRDGGVSLPPYDSLNLGAHCGDNRDSVETNRQRFYQAMNMPSPPVWLEQVHGKAVLNLDEAPFASKQADAAYTHSAGQVCAVMTADCLPVLFCNRAGNQVAAAHAGWRGLCAGVLEETVARFQDSPANILAWLGPAIGPQAFEVGPEVREAFIDKDKKAAQAFRAFGKKYYADIYQLARQRLENLGVTQVYGGDRCTLTESNDFFSYRREKVTGRMASFIWIV